MRLCKPWASLACVLMRARPPSTSTLCSALVHSYMDVVFMLPCTHVRIDKAGREPGQRIKRRTRSTHRAIAALPLLLWRHFLHTFCSIPLLPFFLFLYCTPLTFPSCSFVLALSIIMGFYRPDPVFPSPPPPTSPNLLLLPRV